MRIQYKNTAIGLLEHIDPFSFRICEDAEHSTQEYKTALGLSIVREWPKIVHRFQKKVQYISQPFYEAYNSAAHKLSSVIDAEEINESGTFICRSTPSETNTIFYDIVTEGKGKDFKIYGVVFFFCKHTNKDKPSLALIAQRNGKGIKEYISEEGSKNGLNNISIISDIFTMILFMKYCDLQTKIIKPQSKDFHINCKYLNETNQKIEVLDSTWFTTIVRCDGFHVRGHFRFQPCGQAFKDKKLIWIADFDKSGYTRKAKILTS